MFEDWCMSQTPITRILQSLIPNNAEELSLLRNLVRWAQQLQQADAAAFSARMSFSEEFDPMAFLSALPEELHRYFHGLIEALEIYHSIHGRPMAATDLSLSNDSVRELKQIRDMCLEEGLRSIY